jgi:GTP:adenosylcobinamide-phosphate guanylyltransferase
MAGFGGDQAPHKALLDLLGVPMVARVLSTLAASSSIGRIVVSIDDASVIESLASARELMSAGRLICRSCGPSPAASVAEHLAEVSAGTTVLVTTADHPLLEAAIVEEFLGEVAGNAYAVTAAMVSATTFRARYPDLRRTFIPLRGEGYSGANLFAFRTPQGRDAAEFWCRVESYRKTPWKMAALFGPRVLAAFAMRRLDLPQAMARISATIGCPVGVVQLADAESAIDVDSAEDAEIVRQILRRREGV